MDVKLKLWHRFALLICTVFVFLVGVVIIVASLQFNELPIRREGEGFFTLTRLMMLLVGLLCVFVSIFLFTFPHKLRGGKQDYVVQKTSTGEMRISVSAIESMIQKSLVQHHEIHMQSLKVFNTRGGVIIDLLVDLPSNINIPLALSSLQKNIKKNLNATSGIDAKEIRISVKEAEAEVKESPYLVKPEELALENLIATKDTESQEQNCTKNGEDQSHEQV